MKEEFIKMVNETITYYEDIIKNGYILSKKKVKGKLVIKRAKLKSIGLKMVNKAIKKLEDSKKSWEVDLPTDEQVKAVILARAKKRDDAIQKALDKEERKRKNTGGR